MTTADLVLIPPAMPAAYLPLVPVTDRCVACRKRIRGTVFSCERCLASFSWKCYVRRIASKAERRWLRRLRRGIDDGTNYPLICSACRA